MKFINNPEMNIYLYGLSLADETKNENEQNISDVLISFNELIEKIKIYEFKFEHLARFDEEIETVFDCLEKLFPKESFQSTIELVEKELNECKIINLLFPFSVIFVFLFIYFYLIIDI